MKTANARLARFVDTDLPKVLSSLQSLEKTRMETLKVQDARP